MYSVPRAIRHQANIFLIFKQVAIARRRLLPRRLWHSTAAMDDPLDFEEEDKLLSSPRPAPKRRKVIGLDDLLTDYYAEKTKVVKSLSKKPTASKRCDSDDEDDTAQSNKERMLSKFVDECHKQVHEMSTEDNIPLWGLRIFGHQLPPPLPNFSGIMNCKLLQPFKKKEVFDFNAEEGESFLEGLLMNGWLSKLAFSCGYVEDSIASWTFNKMLYSLKEELQDAACDFWCSILLSNNETDQLSVNLGWFPCYTDINDALRNYGYLSNATDSWSSTSKTTETEFGCEGPPLNISSWIRVLSACCQIRSTGRIFSTSEVEEFLGVVICLSLDRRLQGLSYYLQECLQSIIGFFMENEWNTSCKIVTESIASRIPKDVNCLRVVECISGANDRSKHLRSQLALQILLAACGKDVANGEELQELFLSLNVKDKDCDFFRLYIYLTLMENWLFYNHSVDKGAIHIDKWRKCLRTYSSQITSTDWRSYASKVRNKASYLLQNGIQNKSP